MHHGRRVSRFWSAGVRSNPFRVEFRSSDPVSISRSENRFQSVLSEDTLCRSFSGARGYELILYSDSLSEEIGGSESWEDEEDDRR
jgi:hypothetical protein